MIIELTGIPCSGKTTLIGGLCGCLDGKDNVITSVRSHILKKYHMGIFDHYYSGTFVYDFILLCIFIGNYRKFKNVFCELVKTMCKNEKRFFSRVNVSRNIIKKLSIDHYFRKSCPEKIVFIDEGISHIPFNVFSGMKTVSEEDLHKLLADLCVPDVLIIIDTPAETVKQRASTRNHRRFGKYSAELIENNLNIIDEIKSFYMKKTCVINFDGNDTAGSILDKLSDIKVI